MRNLHHFEIVGGRTKRGRPVIFRAAECSMLERYISYDSCVAGLLRAGGESSGHNRIRTGLQSPRAPRRAPRSDNAYLSELTAPSLSCPPGTAALLVILDAAPGSQHCGPCVARKTTGRTGGPAAGR